MAFLIIVIVSDLKDLFFKTLNIISFLLMIFCDLSSITSGSNKVTFLLFTSSLIIFILLVFFFQALSKFSEYLVYETWVYNIITFS